jgi:hypothetical protein
MEGGEAMRLVTTPQIQDLGWIPFIICKVNGPYFIICPNHMP